MQTATVFGIFWGCVIIVSSMIQNVGMLNVDDLYGKDPAQVGVAGLISIVPALAEIFITIFALGQIVWFVWLGLCCCAATQSEQRNTNYLFDF